MLLYAALKGRTELVQKLTRDDNNLKVTIYIYIYYIYSYTCVVNVKLLFL